MLDAATEKRELENLYAFLKRFNIDKENYFQKYPFWLLPETSKEYIRRLQIIKRLHYDAYLREVATLSDVELSFLHFSEGLLNIIEQNTDENGWVFECDDIFERFGNSLTIEIYETTKKEKPTAEHGYLMGKPLLYSFFSLITGYNHGELWGSYQVRLYLLDKRMKYGFNTDTNANIAVIDKLETEYFPQREYCINNTVYDLALYKHDDYRTPFLLVNFISEFHNTCENPMLLAKKNNIEYVELMYDAYTNSTIFPHLITKYLKRERCVSQFRKITDQTNKYTVIYVYSIEDSAHRNCLKIGQTTVHANLRPNEIKDNSSLLNKAAIKRIDEQLRIAIMPYKLIYTTLAIKPYIDILSGEKGLLQFTDKDFHYYLRNNDKTQYEQVLYKGRPSEWFYIDPQTVKKELRNFKKTDGFLFDNNVYHRKPYSQKSNVYCTKGVLNNQILISFFSPY